MVRALLNHKIPGIAEIVDSLISSSSNIQNIDKSMFLSNRPALIYILASPNFFDPYKCIRSNIYIYILKYECVVFQP